MLLIKADETRTVEIAETISSAVNNAIVNAFRKKGQKAHPVFPKNKKARRRQASKIDRVKFEKVQQALGGEHGRLHPVS